jgi:hypothetical protein
MLVLRSVELQGGFLPRYLLAALAAALLALPAAAAAQDPAPAPTPSQGVGNPEVAMHFPFRVLGVPGITEITDNFDNLDVVVETTGKTRKTSTPLRSWDFRLVLRQRLPVQGSEWHSAAPSMHRHHRYAAAAWTRFGIHAESVCPLDPAFIYQVKVRLTLRAVNGSVSTVHLVQVVNPIAGAQKTS